MAQIFNSFISGVDAGNQQREQRDRRSALDEAGRLYAANDAQGAENALVGAGLLNEAGAYSALNEARRGRTTRQAVSQAMTGLDENASPVDRANAGADAALQAGDTDQWAAFQQYANTLDQQQRQQAGERAQWIGSAAASLLDVPVEQRVERAQALLASSPYANDQHIAQMIDEAGELSDEALTSAAQSSMSAADILGMRRQESQFNRQMAQQERLANGRRNLSTSEVRQFGNDYERGMRQINEAVGPQIMSAMPWANQVASNGAVPNGITQEAALISDQGMLRAVARLQTGVGVLTEGEVRGTLGDNLYNRLQEAGAGFNLNERLRPEVRQALAQLVQQGVNRAAQQSWDYRQNAMDEYASVTNGGAPTGWGMPSVPHPQDMGSLAAAERIAGSNGAPALRLNDVRISPSGRRYQYMGPGNWLPVGEGDREGYQAGRNARVAAGGAPEVPTQAPAPARRSANAPPVGTVDNGYRFRGGDPNDPNNWERVQPGNYQGR